MPEGFWPIAAPTVAWACMVVLAAILWRRTRILRGRLTESETRFSELHARSEKAIAHLHRKVAQDDEDLRSEAISLLEDCLSVIDGRIGANPSWR